MTPDHVDTAQWHQATGYARQICARLFRDGGTPHDAIRAFGLTPQDTPEEDWARAVDKIAQTLCTKPNQVAA